MGIEPTQPAWEAGVLPLNYICNYLIAFIILDLQHTVKKNHSSNCYSIRYNLGEFHAIFTFCAALSCDTTKKNVY